MSTNPPFVISAWIPYAFFITAGLCAIASAVYLGLGGILMRFRFQPPVYIINQKGTGNSAVIGSDNTISAVKRPERPRLTYDNVLWEDAGTGNFGGVIVHGPFCPNDLTPLAIKRGYDKKVDTQLRDNDYIGDRGELLFCLKCNTEYIFGTGIKTIEESRNEVRSLFEGMRRRLGKDD